ncbi:MAG: radical SAM protein [Bacteroidetes bacterium]|nr:radical SAM protein [Bacteroidota bacterium]
MKQGLKNGEILPLMESFYTLQGEGFHSGKAAYFIRLSGCDVGCVWCDVKESWTSSEDQIKSIEEITQMVVTTPSNFVVLTGGEPAMYNLSPLIQKLKESKMFVAIETSGVYPLNGAVDWYTFSPKKFKKPCSEAYVRANELKVIIYNKSDFKWAKEHQTLVNPDCLLYLQPEWGKLDEMVPLIIDFIKENPNWQLSLQNHKYINIP